MKRQRTLAENENIEDSEDRIQELNEDFIEACRIGNISLVENLLQNDVITIFINNYNVNVSNYWPSRQNFLKYENEKFNYKNIFGNSSIIKNYTMIKNHAIKRRKLFESTEYDGNNSFFIKFDKNNNYYIEHIEKYKFEKFEKDFDFVKKEDIKIETQYNNNYCNIL